MERETKRLFDTVASSYNGQHENNALCPLFGGVHCLLHQGPSSIFCSKHAIE